MEDAHLKSEAIRQFALRKDFSETLVRMQADLAHKDAAAYVYCRVCNCPTEIVNCQPVFPVSKICSQCAKLEEHGWIEQAINFHEGIR